MKINIKRNIFLYFIVLLAICIIYILHWVPYQKYPVENFDNTPKPILSTDVKNNAKVNAKYEYDENTDESRIQFNVNIPQNFIKTQEIDIISPYQMKGFCNAPNTNNETIEAKCNTLDMTECANTSCCVLFGDKCVGGDENGPTYDSIYNDPTIKYKDRYYYMGKCYGNCSNYMANDYDRIYVPSQYNMGDISQFINAEQSKKFIIDNTSPSKIPTLTPSIYTNTSTSTSTSTFLPYTTTTTSTSYTGTTTTPYTKTPSEYSNITYPTSKQTQTSITSGSQNTSATSGSQSQISVTSSSQTQSSVTSRYQSTSATSR